MARAAEPGVRPSPEAAYAQWMDACAAAGWRGVPAAEQVPVGEGLGRVTVAPVQARWAAPRSACAAMDGIAIRAASASSPDHAVGRWRLAASAFAWVDTGDPMPAGTDTVVERERVQPGADGSAWITGPAPRGRHVRARGEDISAGRLLIPAGHRLRPADLAAAAAAGHVTLETARRPVAAIIPTGDEIKPIGSALRPGDVVDSNSLWLALRAGETGARPLVSDVQPDDPDAITAEVRRAALAADVVLVIAGSSVGRSDHTAAVLAQVGGLALQGMPPPDHVRQRARLACDWTSPPDVEDWVPVSLTSPSGAQASFGVMATPGRHGAGAISRLMRADAWWRIPIGQAKFARDELIDVQPIPGSPP